MRVFVVESKSNRHISNRIGRPTQARYILIKAHNQSTPTHMVTYTHTQIHTLTKLPVMYIGRDSTFYYPTTLFNPYLVTFS